MIKESYDRHNKRDGHSNYFDAKFKDKYEMFLKGSNVLPQVPS